MRIAAARRGRTDYRQIQIFARPIERYGNARRRRRGKSVEDLAPALGARAARVVVDARPCKEVAATHRDVARDFHRPLTQTTCRAETISDAIGVGAVHRAVAVVVPGIATLDFGVRARANEALDRALITDEERCARRRPHP